LTPFKGLPCVGVALPRPHVCWAVLLLLVLLLLLILLLVLMLILMMLPGVLKDAHLDALIQQHLLSHAVLCHLESRWRPVLLLTTVTAHH
jgi:hypothetical protein